MTPIRILPLAAVLVLASAPLAAQGNVNGRVVDARGGAAVASARIVVDNGQLPGTEADVDGRFSLTLRAGEHVLRVDRLGYAAKEVRVTSPAAAEQVIALDPAPEAVEGVRATVRPVSMRMQQFEDRRVHHNGSGRFLTRDDLQKNEHSTLSDVLRRLPGAQIVHSPRSTDSYLATGRSLAAHSLMRAAPPCYAQIFIDGVQVYSMETGRGSPPPNIDDFHIDDLEAVEYYGIAASTPAEFRTMTSTCGTLVLWTREAS